MSTCDTIHEEEETKDATFVDLLAGDIFPWYKISKSFPLCVNNSARFVGNGVQRTYYLTYVIGFVLMSFIRFRMLKTTYKHSYVQSDCLKYYTFDFENFTHYPIIVSTTTNQTLTSCKNSPLYFLGFVSSEIIRMLICLGWFYSRDRRYGVLKLRYEKLTLKLREMHICVQFPAMLIMLLLNFLLAVVSTYLLIPLFVGLAILSWSCGCQCIDRMMKKLISDYEILFLYILMTLQDVSSVSISCVLSFTSALVDEKHNLIDKFTGINVFYYCIFHCTFFLIPRLLHILKSPKRFKIFITMLNRTLPLFFSLWSYVDIILDIIQTRKYRAFALHKDGFLKVATRSSIRHDPISPNYWIFSVFSLFMPIILSFALIAYNHGFRVFQVFVGDITRNSNFLTRLVFRTFEFIIGMPVYLILSVIFYYIIVPIVLTKFGLDMVRKGEDDERTLEYDPFGLISKHSKYKGFFDLYGLRDFKPNYLPLLQGMEQLGEASIQSAVSLIFLINHYPFITETDNILGLPFPVSIVSFIFSIVSLLVGLYRLSAAIFHSTK